MPINFGSGGDKFQDMNISDYKSEHKLRDKLPGTGEESVKIAKWMVQAHPEKIDAKLLEQLKGHFHHEARLLKEEILTSKGNGVSHSKPENLKQKIGNAVAKFISNAFKKGSVGKSLNRDPREVQILQFEKALELLNKIPTPMPSLTLDPRSGPVRPKDTKQVLDYLAEKGRTFNGISIEERDGIKKYLSAELTRLGDTNPLKNEMEAGLKHIKILEGGSTPAQAKYVADKKAAVAVDDLTDEDIEQATDFDPIKRQQYQESRLDEITDNTDYGVGNDSPIKAEYQVHLNNRDEDDIQELLSDFKADVGETFMNKGFSVEYKREELVDFKAISKGLREGINEQLAKPGLSNVDRLQVKIHEASLKVIDKKIEIFEQALEIEMMGRELSAKNSKGPDGQGIHDATINQLMGKLRALEQEFNSI